MASYSIALFMDTGGPHSSKIEKKDDIAAIQPALSTVVSACSVLWQFCSCIWWVIQQLSFVFWWVLLQLSSLLLVSLVAVKLFTSGGSFSS